MLGDERGRQGRLPEWGQLCYSTEEIDVLVDIIERQFATDCSAMDTFSPGEIGLDVESGVQFAAGLCVILRIALETCRRIDKAASFA